MSNLDIEYLKNKYLDQEKYWRKKIIDEFILYNQHEYLPILVDFTLQTLNMLLINPNFTHKNMPNIDIYRNFDKWLKMTNEYKQVYRTGRLNGFFSVS